jgi:4-carboxymuconolactone decarboxylase
VLEFPIFRTNFARYRAPVKTTEPAMSPDPGYGQQPLAESVPTLAQRADQVLFADVRQRPGLPPRKRSLLTVAALVAPGRVEPLPFDHAPARHNGFGQHELVEAIPHLAFRAGWPVAVSALVRLRELPDAP